MKTTESDTQAVDRVKKALSRISAVRGLDGRLVVDVPVMYPSGATVVVEVERNGDRFWVSDMGHALVETEFVAAQDFFSSAARTAADEYGVGFDGHSMFALWVPEGRLEAAIVCVANASNSACSEAIRAASDAKGRKANEHIFERIQSVFGPKIVAKTADIQGRHAHWEAHNVVIFPNSQKAIFESMSMHSNSISSRFLMFSDIKAADDAVSLNAMVKDLERLDEKAQMVGDVANIIALSAGDDEIRKYAIAS
ncbi:hypothetical protein ACEWPM_015795 [Roseovarius sp. S4756]|uniref:hypothetical protein n=1 Tax=Roseovarius maritimus TaxID=3342637 RepID=UPI00372B0B6C